MKKKSTDGRINVRGRTATNPGLHREESVSAHPQPVCISSLFLLILTRAERTCSEVYVNFSIYIG
jgi:hypothetical protein